MRLFYKGKCIKAMSEGKTIESKSKGILIAKYKFDCSKADLFPEFNEGFEYTFVDEQIDEADVLTVDRETVTVMTYDAEPDEYGVLTTEYEVETPVLINAGDIVTRSIYSNELPTKVKFGYYTGGKLTSEEAQSLMSVEYINTSNVNNMNSMFYNCNQLISLDLSNFNTNNVTDMVCMFYGCNNLTSIDLSNWDTSKVTNMLGMFYGCIKLTSLDLSNFDTSKVTNMGSMFNGCQSLTSLVVSNWDTSNVTNMSYMFYGCQSLTSLDVSNFDTSNVTDMVCMFYYCNNLTSLDVSNWGTSKVAYMASIFSNCNELTSILMNNSDYSSVNKIIEQLPTRTADNKGTLDIIGVDDISQVDITTAESKYWNVLDHVSIHYDSSYFIQGGMEVNGELYDNTNPIYNLCVMTDYIDIEHFREVCVTTNRAEQGITVCTIFEYNSDKEYIGYVSHETEPKVITTYNKSTDVKYIIITAFNVAYAQITPSDVDFDIDFR